MLDKRVDGNDEESWYTNTTNEVTYTISVTNPEGNGFASNIEIKDDISAIEAELLEPAGAMKKVFTSWTISADIEADSPWLKVAADAGDFLITTILMLSLKSHRCNHHIYHCWYS
ncbi:putative hemagglutinin/hemolysin-related protein [Vibrio sp. JCM 19052]|nr:putative hemagglutinin/hemolysin-related protein [Vibrio sp. JCM 19052]